MVLRIKELRLEKGMQLNQLAAKVGVSPPVLANWEAETALPRTRDLPVLAHSLNVTIDSLFVQHNVSAPSQ